MPPRRPAAPPALLACVLAAAALLPLRASAAPALTLSPAALSKNGEEITVSWSGITGVEDSDQIALIPSDPDPAFGKKYPIKFVWLFQSAGATFKTGSGSVKFHVVNHRQDLHFVYLRWPHATNITAAPTGAFAWGQQVVIASAKLSVPDTLRHTPHQLRLSLLPADKRSFYNVQVMWQSLAGGGKAGASTNKKALDKWIKDGKKSGSVKAANASSQTYAPGDLCGSPANDYGYIDPGASNYAVWEKLAPGKVYYYAVQSKGGVWSDVKNFTTPPKASPTKPVKILLAADVGTHNNRDGTWGADGQGFTVFNQFTSYVGNLSGPLVPGIGDVKITEPLVGTHTLPVANLFYALWTIGDFPWGGLQAGSYPVHKALNAKAASGQYHHAFIAGDIAYAEGMGAHWDSFLTNMEPLLSTVPTMYSNGNHESNGKGLPDSALPSQLEGSVPDGGGECGIVYERRLRMPFASGVDIANRPEYYSYSVGPIAVVVLSTEQKWAKGSNQYNWLVAELDKIAALRAKKELPWLVIAFHRPMYVDDPDISQGEGNQWIAENLRQELEPLFAKYQVDMTWTGHTHFYHRSCPAFKGGCAPGTDKVAAPVHIMVGNGGFQPGASVFETQPPWIAKEVFDYGYCEVEATRKELKLACFNADTGAKFDEVTLTKTTSWKPDQAAAVAYYETVKATPTPPGVNLTSDLQAAVAAITTDANFQFIALFSLLGQDKAMNASFGPASAINKLLSAPPGQSLFSMADVAPIYLDFATIIWNALKQFVQALPALEEVEFLERVNSPAVGNKPAGRLWQLLHP